MMRFAKTAISCLLAMLLLAACDPDKIAKLFEVDPLDRQIGFYDWVNYLVATKPNNEVNVNYLLTSFMGPPSETRDTLGASNLKTYVWLRGGRVHTSTSKEGTTHISLAQPGSSETSSSGSSIISTEYCEIKAAVDENGIIRSFGYDGTKCTALFNPSELAVEGFPAENSHISNWDSKLFISFKPQVYF